jgi:hypothetical protein
MANEQQQIQIKASDEILKGTYSNLMQVTHLSEEFILDFMNVYPPQGMGVLGARVIVSPGHLKRMINALQDNLKRYEEATGRKVEEAQAPSEEVGFHA